MNPKGSKMPKTHFKGGRQFYRTFFIGFRATEKEQNFCGRLGIEKPIDVEYVQFKGDGMTVPRIFQCGSTSA
jgi:hypothetical protein